MAREHGVNGPGEMAVELLPVGDIETDPSNARDHSDERGFEALVTSLRTFGQRKPIVLWRETPESPGRVTKAGNGTLLAARQLGWSQIWVTWADGMTLEEADAFALADNQTALLSRWNFQQLAVNLEKLPDGLRPATGFDEGTIKMLLSAEWTPPEGGDTGLGESPAPEMGKPIHVTAAQRTVIEEACEAVRTREGDAKITEGRCLELLCADFLAGA